MSNMSTQLQHLADKNIALDLVRVTEAAALATARYVGRGDKEEADGAAVGAMRVAVQSMHIKGNVIIGEGEKDNAPMLHPGEIVGFGDGSEVDVAIDPIDGTTCAAYGRHNALSAIGMSAPGTMFNPGHSFYCQKIATGAEAASVIDLDAPIEYNLRNVARALGKQVSDLNVFVLDKPRHAKLIQDIRVAGAKVLLHSAGDVAGALMAVDPHSEIDLLVGTGGTPEAIITACGIKGTGGQMYIRMDPQSDAEKKKVEEDGFDLNAILSIDDLIKGNECYFASTGITNGELLRGVHYQGDYAITQSLTTRARTGTWRYIEAYHNIKKLSKMSTVRY